MGIATGVAWLGGLVLLVMLLMMSGSDAAATPIGSLGDVLDGFGVIGSLLFTLTAFVYGGELTVGLGGDMGMFSAGGTASAWLFPLTVTVAALTAVLWWGVRQGRVNPLPTHLHRALYGAGVGLVTGLVLLIVALIFAVRVNQAGIGFELTAAGYRVVLFSTLLVGAAAYIGREAGALARASDLWITALRRLLSTTPRVLRDWLAYTAFGAALFSVLGAIGLVVSMWDGAGFTSIGVALVALLNAAPFAATLGHLGGVSASGALGGATSSSTLTVFSADQPSLWIAVLAAVLLTVFVALWIGTRRPRTERIDWRTAWQLPVVTLVAWLVFGTIFFGVGISAVGSAGFFGGAVNGGVGIALWSGLAFFVWAAAVEIGAQTLPRVAYGIMPRAHAAIVGRRTLAAWVAGVPAGGANSAAALVPGAEFVGIPAAPGGTTGAPAPAVAAASALPEPKPLSPGAKRGLLIALISVGGVIVLAVAAGIAIAIANASRTPEAVVQQYVDHIAAGRAEAANALVDPNVPNAQRQFLSDDTMAVAAERITDVSTKTAEGGSSDSAYVTVTYRLDGVEQEEMLTVVKGEPEFLVLDTWTIEDSLARTVDVQVIGQGAATIGDTQIPISFDGDYGHAEIVLYPGTYPLTSTGSDYFALEETDLTVAGMGSMIGSTLTFAPTDALRDEVKSQVDALLQKCLAETTASPEGCPFGVYTYNDDTKVTWTMTEEPTLEFDEAGTRVSVQGVAVGSYTEDFFGTTRDEDDETPFSMYGEIAVDGDTATVTFDDRWW
ncbi:hypothetical protein [Microbacterium sp. NPDC058345]|uniref:hypothetical protein n=1 Tax=Microbacterium sp. NPDC058345 TaxID=3346455 RepID=UPI003665D5E0